jgi:hypothetical protein
MDFHVLCKFTKVLSRKERKSFKVFSSGFSEDLCSEKEDKQITMLNFSENFNTLYLF